MLVDYRERGVEVDEHEFCLVVVGDGGDHRWLGWQSDGGGPDNGRMVSRGVVREWDDDQGFGVIDSPDTPGGCWTHFSSIVMDGYRCLAPGDPVAFAWEEPGQDGYDYRAVVVWPPGIEPSTPQRADGSEPSDAYRSTLIIRWDDGTVSQ